MNFRRLAFPHLAPDYTLSLAESYDLDLILHNSPWYQEQRAQIMQAGIRYVISADASTEEGIMHSKGRGGPGIFIGGTWLKRSSHITAKVLDLKEEREVGTVQAEATGEWIWLFPLPIIKPAFTESGLCEDLGEELAKFLAGETTPTSSDSEHGEDD